MYKRRSRSVLLPDRPKVTRLQVRNPPIEFRHVVLHLLWFLAMSLPEAALLRVALSIRESGSWDRTDLAAAVRLTPTFFVVKLIYLMIVGVGLLLLIVPGVWLAVRASSLPAARGTRPRPCG